jgi:hypothetical protein
MEIGMLKYSQPSLLLSSALVFFIFSNSARSQEFNYYIVSANKNQISIINRSEMSKLADEHVRAPLITVRREPKTFNYTYDFAVMDTDFNCRGRKVLSLKMTLYMRDGWPSPMQPPPGRGREWDPAPASSQAGQALDFVCGYVHPANNGIPPGTSLSTIIAGIFAGPWPVP